MKKELEEIAKKTDRELQEGIYFNIRHNLRTNKSIKVWVTVIAIIQLLAVFCAFILAGEMS
jgi:hypothetical protein